MSKPSGSQATTSRKEPGAPFRSVYMVFRCFFVFETTDYQRHGNWIPWELRMSFVQRSHVQGTMVAHPARRCKHLWWWWPVAFLVFWPACWRCAEDTALVERLGGGASVVFLEKGGLNIRLLDGCI